MKYGIKQRIAFWPFFADSKGSALILVLVIVTVVTIMCSIVLAGITLQQKVILKTIHERQALYLAEAGIQKAMWYLSGDGGKGLRWRTEDETIELFDDHLASITVQEWGGYLIVQSKVNYKKISKCVRVLLGEYPPEPFKQAVVIGGVNYPLVVTGKNRIMGDVTVGAKGVEKGTIQGRGFEGKTPVEGKIIRTQDPKMPYFDPVLFSTMIQKYRNTMRNPSGYQIVDSDVSLTKELLDSLQCKKLYVCGNVVIPDEDVGGASPSAFTIICTGDMIIEGNALLGPFTELAAGGQLFVKGNVRIKNCIFFAEKGIELTGNCVIAGQFISSGNIVLQDSVRLDYPSVVYCCGSVKDNTIRGLVSLQDRSTVRGAVILCPDTEKLSDKRDETQMKIDQNAKLVGVLYSTHSTELHGTVFGNVSTGAFYLYVSPTTYVNWLQDSMIDRLKLPKSFLMPLHFSKNPNLGILVWEEVIDHGLPQISLKRDMNQ